MRATPMDLDQFEKRKADHIQHSLDLKNEALGASGLDRIHLVHEALPELDFQDVSIQSQFLGKKLQTPFFVCGMTAGHGDAPAMNRLLAKVCEARGWVMGVGSQRRDLESSSEEWKSFRSSFPRLGLIGNLGLTQVIQASVSQVRRVVTDLGADALAIHLNALQEVLQPEGTPQFHGGFAALKKLTQSLKIPILLKETGCGFSKKTLQRISRLKLCAVDLSGLGGTHWGRIEGARAPEHSLQAQAAQTFAHWGESTVQSVLAAQGVLREKTEIWASGGVRSGLDAAKLIALGSHRIGYAKPALMAALKGEQALHQWMAQQEFELKVALFCTGSKNLEALRKKKWNLS
ncbi:MAG: type 2 isopentenyl-diphosphate Delta-isomerase [Bdellovibrionia bacterium]